MPGDDPYRPPQADAVPPQAPPSPQAARYAAEADATAALVIGVATAVVDVLILGAVLQEDSSLPLVLTAFTVPAALVGLGNGLRQRRSRYRQRALLGAWLCAMALLAAGAGALAARSSDPPGPRWSVSR